MFALGLRRCIYHSFMQTEEVMPRGNILVVLHSVMAAAESGGVK